MGRGHGVSGAAVWLAVAPSVGVTEPLQVTTGMLVCAASALLPDLDHPKATLAQSVPLFGSAAAGAIAAATGGHRHGLHSLLAVAACLYGMPWLVAAQFPLPGGAFSIPAGAAIVLVCTLVWALPVLGFARSWLVAWPVGVVLAIAAAWLMPELVGWLATCVTIGFAAHLAGDFLTEGGIPVLWPLPIRLPSTPLTPARGYFALPLLGPTGSRRELLLTIVLSAAVVAATVLLWLPAAGVDVAVLFGAIGGTR